MEKLFPDFERITRKTAIKFPKNHFELAAWSMQQVTCGIDEVGRGCLAGPLVSAAVIVPINTSYKGLKDSKLLTEAERNQSYRWITKHCWYGVGIVSAQFIDIQNIWQATLISMKRAVINLLSIYPYAPHVILIDAMPLTLHDTAYRAIPIRSFPNGEKKSISIAAASIVAKVYRDALMTTADTVIKGYGLSQHKGYGTIAHKEAIVKKGPSIIHRESFLKNIIIEERNPITHKAQQSTIHETEYY